MAITQLSVFLMNHPGQLVTAVERIAGTGANLRAMSLAEANDFGILRIIVSDTEKVREALSDTFLISRTEVVAARMDDRSGALLPILRALSEKEINVEYMYAFTAAKASQAYVVMRVNDVAAAEAALNAKGIETLSDTSLPV